MRNRVLFSGRPSSSLWTTSWRTNSATDRADGCSCIWAPRRPATPYLPSDHHPLPADRFLPPGSAVPATTWSGLRTVVRTQSTPLNLFLICSCNRFTSKDQSPQIGCDKGQRDSRVWRVKQLLLALGGEGCGGWVNAAVRSSETGSQDELCPLPNLPRPVPKMTVAMAWDG